MAHPDALLGTTIGGKWVVERSLTSGGMGTVYVAAHTDTSRRVALKVIKSEATASADFVARFRRETAALAAMSHPNIVTFLDSGVEQGTFYLVMELLQGTPLRAALGAPMPWQRAFRIAADICRGLAAIHKAGIVHRDLKPENVFLQASEGHEDFVKLIDFGIVRRDETLTAAGLSTQTGAIVGTPGYISPEQLQAKAATTVSDIYAVGVMLYEMVTGRFPFLANSVQAMLVKQLLDPLPPPSSFIELPPNVDQLIMSFLAREPEHRPQSAYVALGLMLDAVKSGASVEPQSSIGVSSVPALPRPASLPAAEATENFTAFPPPVTAPTPRVPTSAPVESMAAPSRRMTARRITLLASGAAVALALAAGVLVLENVGSAATTPPLAENTGSGPSELDGGAAVTMKIEGVQQHSATEVMKTSNDTVTPIEVKPKPPPPPAASGPPSDKKLDARSKETAKEKRDSTKKAVDKSVTPSVGANGAPPPPPIPDRPPVSASSARARPMAQELVSFVDGKKAALLKCGGDRTPRPLTLAFQPDGSVTLTTADTDEPIACAKQMVASWKFDAFPGKPVVITILVPLGTRKPPPPPDLSK